jgi:hypothetical protein
VPAFVTSQLNSADINIFTVKTRHNSIQKLNTKNKIKVSAKC